MSQSSVPFDKIFDPYNEEDSLNIFYFVASCGKIFSTRFGYTKIKFYIFEFLRAVVFMKSKSWNVVISKNKQCQLIHQYFGKILQHVGFLTYFQFSFHPQHSQLINNESTVGVDKSKNITLASFIKNFTYKQAQISLHKTYIRITGCK